MVIAGCDSLGNDDVAALQLDQQRRARILAEVAEASRGGLYAE